MCKCLEEKKKEVEAKILTINELKSQVEQVNNKRASTNMNEIFELRNRVDELQNENSRLTSENDSLNKKLDRKNVYLTFSLSNP